MRKIALLKRRYNRAKRRLALGQGKPDDKYLLDRLSKELGYSPVKQKAHPN